MGNSQSKRKKPKTETVPEIKQIEPEIKVEKPKNVPETTKIEEVKILTVEPTEPLMKIVEEEVEPDFFEDKNQKNILEPEEIKKIPEITIEIDKLNPTITVDTPETPETISEEKPKKKTRTMTVMQSFRKLVGGGEENRSLTQYSSFRTNKIDSSTSEKFLDKKNSFIDPDADLFTILCIGAGGAGKSTVRGKIKSKTNLSSSVVN